MVEVEPLFNIKSTPIGLLSLVLKSLKIDAWKKYEPLTGAVNSKVEVL